MAVQKGAFSFRIFNSNSFILLPMFNTSICFYLGEEKSDTGNNPENQGKFKNIIVILIWNILSWFLATPSDIWKSNIFTIKIYFVITCSNIVLSEAQFYLISFVFYCFISNHLNWKVGSYWKRHTLFLNKQRGQ